MNVQMMLNLKGKRKFLFACLALSGIAYALLASTDIVTTRSAVSVAAATELTHRSEAGTPARDEAAGTLSRASLDYFPANYVNQARDGDGNVMTYEHD